MNSIISAQKPTSGVSAEPVQAIKPPFSKARPVIKARVLLKSEYGQHSLWRVTFQPDESLIFMRPKMLKSDKQCDKMRRESHSNRR